MIKYLVFLLLPMFCFSQPVLTNSIVPEFGTQYDAQFIENPDFNPGPGGVNQTWNFSSLQGQLELHFNMLDPNETPESDQFPDASFVWQLVEFESFFYYKSDEDSISQMGTAVANDTETTFLVINSNLEDALQFPITYETSYEYFTAYDNYLFGNNIFSGQRNGTLTADGYGTIITPYGTYEDVLRLKIVTEEFGIGSTQYAWYDTNHFIPILVYETSTDPEVTPSLYYTNIDNIVATNEVEESNLSILYSSAFNSIVIKSDTDNIDIDAINLYSANAGKIKSYPDLNKYQSSNEIELKTPFYLPMGVYFIQYIEKNEAKAISFYVD